ncbi:FecR family protein [Chitinophaga cymbidii]|uniref:Anti-sigma factor n=1 Tax=Chitinophaga cymbidii TaxID=1096750 RepID=A0A512RM48_9BACT|nr:FecR domain-containing protein [Chitinophaga cymbidii]GEP96781.1 hypothetical protein CCY01nite_30410 [Chitinophaga cymbidii]
MIRSAVEKLIDRYLRGNATPADETLVAQWLDSLAAESSHTGKQLSPQEKELLRKKMLKAIRKRTLGGTVWWKPAGIAAAVVSVLLGGYLLLRLQSPSPKPVYQVFRTGLGEQKMILLPDSSRIWLGPNSELQYPEQYAHLRNIVLVSGEAFFDVMPDASHQFTVAVDSLQVAVLGTSFNVRAYRNLPALNIAVNTGKIKVTRSGNVLGLLSAGQTIRYDRSGGAVATGTFNPEAAEGWKNNRLNFDNTPLAEVLHMLENYYPVRFTLEHPQPVVISGSLNMKMKPEQVMNVLREITGNSIRFVRQSDQQYLVQ